METNMPIELHWYEPEQIIFVRAEGDVSLQEMRDLFKTKVASILWTVSTTSYTSSSTLANWAKSLRRQSTNWRRRTG